MEDILQSRAEKLNGRQYREELTSEEEEQLKKDKLVVVFGASDDLTEFRWAINDEVWSYNWADIYFRYKEILVNKCEDDCPYYEELVKSARWKWYMIRANRWENDVSWSYKTQIKHQTFDVMEDDYIYCKAIIFHVDSIA